MKQLLSSAIFAAVIPLSSLISGEWSGVVTLTNDISSDPHISVNSNSKGAVIWSKYVDNQPLIATSFYDGIYWHDSYTISDQAHNVNPSIRIDSNDDQLAIWETFDDSGRRISSAFCHGESAWSDNETISTSLNNAFSSLDMNPSGQSIAGWVNLIDNRIEVRTHTNPDGWSEISYLPPSEGNKQSLQLAIDRAGNCIALWIDVDEGLVYSSHTLSGFNSDWSPATIISQPGLNSNPTIAYNQSGDACALWVDNNSYYIYSNRFSGGQWNETPTLVTSDYCYSPVCAGGDNVFYAAWVNLGTGNNQIVIGDGETWDSILDISPNPANDAPVIAANSLTSTTLFADLIDGQILGSSFDGTPPPSTTIVSSGNLNMTPQVAASPTINGACWFNIDGIGQSIQANIEFLN